MPRSRPDLLAGPVGPTLLRLAGPMVIGLVSVITFNLVDTFWVGRLGGRELAAMAFTFPVSLLVTSVAMGMGIGMTSVVSRAIGAGAIGQVRRLVTDGLLLANVLVVLFAISGLLTIDPLFAALGAPPDLVALVRRYMVPWYAGIGFLVIPMVGNSAIRATGDTRTPSLIMMIAGGVNLVLDPLLIFGIGPFPRLELQGAAVTTVAAYAITFLAALWILGRRERLLDASRPRLAEVMESWRRILRIGVPAAGTQMLVPLGTGILTRMVAGYGAEAVAGYGVATRIEALSLIGPMALASALAPFAGQNLGARRLPRVRAAISFAAKAALAYGLAVAALLALLAPALARAFNAHAEIVAGTTMYLRIVPVGYGLVGILFAVSATFNAANEPLRSAFLIFVRLLALAVPLAYLGSLRGGLPGLYAGISAANVLVGMLAFLLVGRYLAETERRLAEGRPVSFAG